MQGGDCRAPCLADLSQLSKGAALLHKISATERANLGHQLGRRVHCNLLMPAGVTRQNLI
jgi:hypothetical protein